MLHPAQPILGRKYGTYLSLSLFVAKYSCPEVTYIEYADDIYVKRGGGTDYGSVVQVTCEVGYVKDPNVRESTCTTAGEWDPPIPACVGKTNHSRLITMMINLIMMDDH